MAIGWLKWPKGFHVRQEIFVISSRLNLDRHLIAAACFQLLEWSDKNADRGFVPELSADCVDSIIEIDGFASALESVGWIRRRNGGFEITQFNETIGPGRGKISNSRRTRGRDEYVYFILAPDSRSIKVGISFSPESRLDGLQTGNPDQLELLGCFRAGRDQERKIHDEYAAFVVQGEWLAVCDEVRQLVLNLLGTEAHEKICRIETHCKFSAP